MITDELTKIRSCAGCISAAFDTYSQNFAKIFKKTWIAVIVLSIVSGVSSIVSFHYSKELAGSANDVAAMVFNSTMILLGGIVFGIMCLLIGLWAVAKVVSMVNGDKTAKNYRKLIKCEASGIGIVFIETLLFAALAMAIIKYAAAQTATVTIIVIAALIIAMIVNLLIFVPLSFSFTKYFIEPNSRYRNIFGIYWKRGFHYWGFLFKVMIVAVLMAVIIISFTSMHMLVLQIATRINQVGIMTGDADGLPSYFGYIMFMSQVIGTFIMMYFTFYFIMVYCFAYGSVEARHKKLEQMKNEIAS